MLRAPQKILVAPLDWGLGHATRCIPIIRLLIAQGHTVYLGTTPTTESVLRTEFPDLPCIQLPAYNVKYSRTAGGLPWKLALQLPKILFTIWKEHKVMMQAVATYGIDRIISDNRYGLWHTQRPSVIITHQVHIQVPFSSIVQGIVNRLHHRLIRRFSVCWIPDTHQHDFGGRLTLTANLSIPCTYLGPLSRFAVAPKQNINSDYWLFLLSGPEPQRTFFEKKILSQCHTLKERVILVRGCEGKPVTSSIPSHWIVYDLLHQQALEPLLKAAKGVICRSGYSTLMDIAVLGKKAGLVPTPGQTEQEYLADYWANRDGYVTQHQADFDIKQMLAALEQEKTPMPMPMENELAREIEKWMASYTGT